jgi:hypothetical protein
MLTGTCLGSGVSDTGEQGRRPEVLMNQAASNEPLIHSYDVERHAIRCGAPGHTSATKHARDVTCPECLRLLAEVEPAAQRS